MTNVRPTSMHCRNLWCIKSLRVDRSKFPMVFTSVVKNEANKFTTFIHTSIEYLLLPRLKNYTEDLA